MSLDSPWEEARHQEDDGDAVCLPSHLRRVGLGATHGPQRARLLHPWGSPGDNAAMPSSGDLPHPRIKPRSLTPPALTGGFFTTSATWGAQG